MPSEPDLTVRPATAEDADAVATVYLAAREAAVPAIPPLVHPPDEVRRWVRSRFDDPAAEVWVAEGAGGVLGLLLLEESWVHSLYVVPDRTGEGIGSALLDVAKAVRPDGLGLWVFESNERARRFYARHGFTEVRRTDGSDNEERAPDVELAWATVPALRSRVDDLDDALARLLAERAAATAAIQRVKDVPGHAGRDPEREAEIAARMARLAPALGEGRLGRIMAVVITESLDAFERGPDPAPDQTRSAR